MVCVIVCDNLNVFFEYEFGLGIRLGRVEDMFNIFWKRILDIRVFSIATNT